MSVGCCLVLPSRAVSNLDVESKLTRHYSAPWHQQRNIFHPSSRPPCVEELHTHAKGGPSPLQRDHQQRRAICRERRVTIAVSVPPPMPSYPSPRTLRKRGRTIRTCDRSSPTECCHFSPFSKKAVPTDSDGEAVSPPLGQRSKCPVPNVPSTLDKQTNWTRALPLPTPEERMKNHSQVVTSCLIPINVTGLGFDRDASVRCSLVHSQSVLQRRRKLRRRKTVAGIPRQVQRDLDSDDSPGSRERTVIVHASLDTTACSEDLASRLSSTKDSGCQTEDFLIPSSSGAPSRRRIRAQRGLLQGASLSLPLSLSYSAGNISSLTPDATMFNGTAAGALRLRSRSLPREGSGGGRLADESRLRRVNNSDDEDDEELSRFDTEDDFLSGGVPAELKDEEGSTDDQAAPHGARQPDHGGWMERGRSRLPLGRGGAADMMGSCCEISSSSDTFSSPVHSSVSGGQAGGVGHLVGQGLMMDHKDDHQSSSGNWSGSSSTCPSQTSETMLMPPCPASPSPLTGSSHCDSELSLNAAACHLGGGANDDPYHGGMRSQRAGSFSSAAMDLLEDAGVSTASDGEWSYPPHPDPPRPLDFSPEPSSREAEGSLGCPSFTSMATYESSYSDTPSRVSEKADAVSHYSVDTEGYYTSMHFDCGLKESRSFTYNHYDAAAGHDCSHTPTDLGGMSMDTLSRRCLSLRKPRAKPSPPQRSSSLRQISDLLPEQKEPKICCGQTLPLSAIERKLQLNLAGGSSPGGGRHGHTQETLFLGRKSGEAWAELPDNMGLFGSMDTHSFKDEGAVQSDYADLWLLNDLKSNSDPYRSLSNSSTATGTTVVECVRSQECCSESQTSQSGSRATTPSLPSSSSVGEGGMGEFKLASPEKLAGLASPSSGYSSQSETPTSCFPAAFFPVGPLSPTPGGKRKPKVPERKSSLSSSGSAASTKRDLELPIIPPTHLDLSALQDIGAKTPSVHRNHVVHLPHQSKPTVAAKKKAMTTAPSSEVSGGVRFMAITPTVLHAVQLRSISKEPECGRDIVGADGRAACPAVNPDAALSASRSLDFKASPQLYRSYPHSASSEFCESLFLAEEEAPACVAASEARSKQDGQAPGDALESATEFRLQSDKRSEQDFCLDGTDLLAETASSSFSFPQEGEVSLEDSEVSRPLSPGGATAFESDSSAPPRPEPSDEEPSSWCLSDALGSPPVQHDDDAAERCDGLDKGPASGYQPETSQAISDVGDRDMGYESSGVSTSSGSRDSKDGSTPDREEYCITESTASDTAMSPPPSEDAPAEDNDNVFLSPTKTRTTEDLFAMIHRSKRKVLGRKDSGEMSAKNRLSSSASSGLAPATPPPANGNGAAPAATSPSSPASSPMTPTGQQPQKSPGNIYRSAKKSSTSNEEFKLLLLRKGSRSEHSYRMSAAEILKSPVAPKSPADWLAAAAGGDGPCGGGQSSEESSPSSSPVVPAMPDLVPNNHYYPKVANGESYSPKVYHGSSSAASRQGRSRIPPPANSSRYGARGRVYTAPMQAISEGETENSDGSPHDDHRPSLT